MQSYRQQMTWDMQRQEHEYKRGQNKILIDTIARATGEGISDPLKVAQMGAKAGLTSPQHMVMLRKLTGRSAQDINNVLANQYLTAQKANDTAGMVRSAESLRRFNQARKGMRTLEQERQLAETKAAARAKYRRGGSGSPKQPKLPWWVKQDIQNVRKLNDGAERDETDAKYFDKTNPQYANTLRDRAKKRRARANTIQTRIDSYNRRAGITYYNRPQTTKPPPTSGGGWSNEAAPKKTEPAQGRSQQRMVPGKIYTNSRGEKIKLVKRGGKWVIVTIPK